jgi:hypothetical protein
MRKRHVRTALSTCPATLTQRSCFLRPALLRTPRDPDLPLRGKRASATGGVCRFLASNRAEMCSSSALCGFRAHWRRWPSCSPNAGRRRQATAPCRCLRTARRLERLLAPVGKAAGVGLRSVARDGFALKGALTCGRESRSRERGVTSVFAQFGFGSTECGAPGEWGSLLCGANVDRHLLRPR